jgi:hypothetical protein
MRHSVVLVAPQCVHTRPVMRMRGLRFFFISTLGGAGAPALLASCGMMDMWYLNLISFLPDTVPVVSGSLDDVVQVLVDASAATLGGGPV